MGQIGFADIQPVGGVLAGGQLEDVGDESRHTQAKDVDACEQSTTGISGGEPSSGREPGTRLPHL